MSPLAALPPGVVGLPDHEAHARAHLDPAVWAYLEGHAPGGASPADHRATWDRLALVPRILRPRPAPSTRVRLLGRELAHPMLLAPLAYQRLFHPDGEVAAAVAASAQEAGYVLSTLSSVRLETVAGAVRDDVHRGPLWFQLYFQRERDDTLELVRRAEAAGYEALVFTVDAPVKRRSGFQLPAGIAPVNLRKPLAESVGQGSVAELLATAPDWDDLEWLVGITRLPVVLKGVLHPDDALEAVRRGARALVVSSHGDRTLEGAVSSLDALPAIADALGGAVPLLLDGGVRRGTDVLRAAALGATAVLVGRPLAWGLATAGAVGVAHVLRLLRDELEAAMALCGVSDLAALPPDLLGRVG